MDKKQVAILFFISILVLILVFPLPYAFSGDPTALSKKAAQLKLTTSRQSAIKLLGHSTWAVIPGDKGEWAITDPGIKLELYWKNRPYAPVVVQFDSADKVVGWDEGRDSCAVYCKYFEPPNEYACSKSDRAKFCK
jgi:hypothetical protein